ncbi:MAG: Ig-like domain-containing protein [Lachnospiraceae bacterium]|nr:Ig-like domain-containing protein [Lachnospiraceae bacterium]
MKKKKSDNKIIIKKITAGVIALAIVTAGVFTTKAVIKKIDTKKRHEQLVKMNEEGADTVNEIYLNMGDQKVMVGATIQVEAYVVPQTELAASVEFSSSDSNIFTVTQLGMITVNSAGKAVLTAKTGNLATSITIEGVTDEAEVTSEPSVKTLPKEYAGISGSATLKPQSANVVYNGQDNDILQEDDASDEPNGDQEAGNGNTSIGVDTVIPETEPDLSPEELQRVRENIENYGFTKCQDSS